MSRLLVAFLAVVGIFALNVSSAKAEYYVVGGYYQQPQPLYYTIPIQIQGQAGYYYNQQGQLTYKNDLSATLSYNDGQGTRTITAFNNQSATLRNDGIDRKKEEGVRDTYVKNPPIQYYYVPVVPVQTVRVTYGGRRR